MSKAKSSSIVPKNLKLTHNGYFQETFQIKRFARAFLGKVLPKATLACLNLKRLTVEKRDMADELFKGVIADVVYRVPVKGTKKFVNFFIVIEHKSRQDFLTIFQLWCYVYQICRLEFLAAKKRGETKADYRLPPVIAIILYHGQSKFQGKTELSDLFAPLPGLEQYLPKLQAILFDLSTIDDDDPIMNDPEVPELRVVLMVLKMVFRRDVVPKIKEVIQELKPYSDDPAMRRFIRMTWVYLANNAKHLKRGLNTILDTFREITGEKDMPTMVQIWKAEGKAEGIAEGRAEGEAKGTVLTLLRVRFKGVPRNIEKAVRAMTDLTALKSLAVHAETCKSLDEFAEALK